jgi:hypothetical protein
MTAYRLRRDRIKFFLLGVSAALGTILLVGATSGPPGPPHYGRYQVSAWGTRLGGNAGGMGAFVVDTATGETKMAYTVLYGRPGEKTVVIDNLHKPFGMIQEDGSTRPRTNDPCDDPTE